MADLRFDVGIEADFARVVRHLLGHEVDDIEARLAEIVEALELLARHPLIGRPAGGAKRDLVIGHGSRGYVARYRFDAGLDQVLVLALRSQREAGFVDR